MLKKYFMLVSVCWGISSSAQAVILNAEDNQDIATLQKLTPMVKKTRDDIQTQIQKEQKVSKQWFPPLDEKKLEQLVKLSADPKSLWPDNIYPKSFSSEQSPNLKEYGLQIGESYKPGFFLEEITLFMNALKERKKSGGGLTFEDMAELQKCQVDLNSLGKTLAEFLPLVEDSKRVYEKFSNKLNTLYLIIMGPIQRNDQSIKPLKTMNMQDMYIQGEFFSLKEVGKKHIEPSLKTATTTFEEEFIKTKLFYDAASSVFETSLNVWGNIAMLNAHIYEEHGDDSLTLKLPKIHDLNAKK